MKQKLSILFLLCCVFVSGCSSKEAASIEVIGGADGPTQISIASDKKQDDKRSDKKAVRMVRMEDELYYDSGKESEIEGRCGVMDGEITSAVDEFSIPTKNNQSNFDKDFSYQIGAENTIEIFIDDTWMVFDKVKADKDISQYKYGFELKGTMPNAEGESKWIVFTNDKELTFEKASKSLYSSDSRDQADFYVLLME